MGLSQRRATASQHSRSKTKTIAPAATVAASTPPFFRSSFMHLILPPAQSRGEKWRHRCLAKLSGDWPDWTGEERLGPSIPTLHFAPALNLLPNHNPSPSLTPAAVARRQ